MTIISDPQMSPRWPASATHDTQANAFYVYLSPLPVVRTVAVTDLINVDYDAQGLPVGVEILAPVGVADIPEGEQ